MHTKSNTNVVTKYLRAVQLLCLYGCVCVCCGCAWYVGCMANWLALFAVAIASAVGVRVCVCNA